MAFAGSWVGNALAQVAGQGNPLDSLPRPPSLGSPGVGVPLQLAPPPAPAVSVMQMQVMPVRFDVQGVKSVPFERIAALFAPLAGQPVTVSALVDKAQQATGIYRDAGLALSFVYIPTQSFDGGVVRVVAVEGYVAELRIEGDAGRSSDTMREIVAPVLAERPLRLETFERYTGVLGRLPGFTIAAQAPLPTSTDGATVLTLKTTHKPYSLAVGTELRRSQSRAVLTGTLNDPLVAGSQLGASTLLSGVSGEFLAGLHYQQLIGDEGLVLRAAVSAYRGRGEVATSASGATPAFERSNRQIRREVTASYPLLLSSTRTLTGTGGIYSINTVESYSEPTSGARIAEETGVRAGFVQLAYEQVEAAASRSASVLLAHGINGAGAHSVITSNVPGLGGAGSSRVDFTRLVVEGREARRFGPAWGAAVSFAAQFSPHALPSTERISFGGARFARGYAAGDAAGDRGWGVGLEVNRSFAGIGVLRQIQPYVLLETARVRAKQFMPMPERLSSVGVGLRLGDQQHYLVDLAVAKATGDPSPENPQRNPRLTLMVSWKL